MNIIFFGSPQYSCKVLNTLTRSGKIYAVETNKGLIKTEKVVICSGLWSKEIAKNSGFDIPIWPCEHYYLLTQGLCKYCAFTYRIYIAKISLKEEILSRFFLLFTQIISYVKLVFLQFGMADWMFTHGTIFGNWSQKIFIQH